MRIVVDGRPLCRGMAGTAVFQRLAIDNMLRCWTGVELVIVCPAKLPEPLASAWRGKATIVEDANSLLARSSFFAWYMLKMPLFLRRWRPDLFWTPSPSLPCSVPAGVRTLVIVHDVVNKEFARTMSWKNRVQSCLLFDRSVRRADYIWTNSAYTREALLRYFPRLAAKPIFTGLSVDSSCFRPMDVTAVQRESIVKKYNLTGEGFILFVGTLEPRKNLGFLLSLMPAIYARSGMKLLVVGARGWKCDRDISARMKDPALQESVLFTGYVTDTELALLYNLARCYVSTSLNEGFGMPQLEALHCGCPVVCPNNSAQREVVAGLGTTVDGWDRDVWIETVLHNASAPRQACHIPERYCWTNIIRSLYEFLHNETVS